MEDVKRIYANIKLPVDVYLNGEFKMLYDQMQIKMEMPNISDVTYFNNIINEKTMEIEKEIEERIQEENVVEKNSDDEVDDTQEEEEEEEIKIYNSDYPPKKHKKRWNTTFKQNIKRNQLTKKNYLVIDT